MIAIRLTYVAVPESEATTAKRLGVLRIQTGATQSRREACEQAAPPRSRLEGREFASDPCRCFPGSHQFRSRLEHLGHEPLASFALTLEVRPVNGSSGLELGNIGFQPLDAGI